MSRTLRTFPPQSFTGAPLVLQRVLGLRAPSPPIVFKDVVSGSAAPSGTVAERSLRQSPVAMTRTVFAGHRRGHWSSFPAVVQTSQISVSDVVSGRASPTGTLVEGFANVPTLGRVVMMLAGGRRHGHVTFPGPAVVTYGGIQQSDSPSGTSSATGSVVQTLTESYSPTGSASPSGFVGESIIGGAIVTTLNVNLVAVPESKGLWRRRVMAGVFAPMVVNPPVPPAIEAGPIRKFAGRTRLDARRRRTIHVLAKPIVVGPTFYTDIVSGSAAPSGSKLDTLIHASTPSGSAAASGTVSQVRVLGDAPTGSASPSGTRTDSRIGNDLVFGSSSATGSATDSYSTGSVSSDNPFGQATPAGSRVEALTGSNSPSGTATASGVIVERRVYPDAVSGSSSATGNLFFEQHVWNDTPTGVTVAPSGVVVEAFFGFVAPFGASTATGSLKEKFSRGSGSPITFKTSGWRSRWTVKLRV